MCFENIFYLEYIAFALFIIGVPVLLFLKKPRRIIRYVVLVCALVLFGFLQWACPRPAGALELVFYGPWDTATRLPLIIKLGLVIAGAFFFGRYYCGWICPKGAVQELLYRPRTALNVPKKIDRPLRYVKYVVLIATILVPVAFDTRFMKHFGPFRVLFNLGGPAYLVIFLFIILLASIFVGRPFCRYFCPTGALLGIIQRFASLLKVRVVNRAGCTGCESAQKVCQTGAISCRSGDDKGSTNIDHAECVECMECVDDCNNSVIDYSVKRKEAD